MDKAVMSVRMKKWAGIIQEAAVSGLTKSEFCKRSIKLGKSIKRIRNGSIKNNPNLKYIFIDSSLEAVGRDFLDNSKEKLTIITDGDISHIQSLIGTEGENIKIISRIDSYLDLRNTNHEVANAVGFWW